MTSILSVRSLASSGLMLTAGALFQAVAGFLSQLVLMRLLVPEDFGRFAVVLAGCSLMQTLLSLRLNMLIIRVPEAEMTPERVSRYQAALVWETAASSLVTLIWLFAAGLAELSTVTLVAALALAQWTNQITAFYERRMAYGGITLVETGSQLLGHGVALALVLAGAGAAALYIRELVVALARLAAFARLGALAPPCWRLPRLNDIRLLLAEVRTLWLEGVTESGFARLVVLGTGWLAGLHGTGIFTQSQRIAIIPHQLLAPVVVRLAANAFSRAADARQRRRLLRWSVSGTLTTMVVAAIVANLFADPVIPLLFGAQWAGVIHLLGAMTGVIVFLSAFEVLRAYCFTRSRVRLVLAARLGQFAVFLVGLALAAQSSDPVTILAWSLSAAYVVAFAVVAGGLALGLGLTPPAEAAAMPSPAGPPPG